MVAPELRVFVEPQQGASYADQLAMARLPRATYSLMLALLPVTATICGILLLDQLPGRQDLVGLGLVVGGVALHRAPVEA